MANTNLTAGSIAFTGYNGDGNDNLSFVVLTHVAQGAVINFTDNDWNDGRFASGDDAESIFTWTATSDVAAGTVIEIDNLKDAELGLRASTGSVAWVNTHNTGLKDTNETVYAYVGSSSSPAFLAAIANNGFSDNGTLTGTGLIEGVTAIDLGNKVATSGYTGPLSGQASFADYLSYINNTSYWSTEAGAPFSKAPFTVGDDGNDTPVGDPGDTDDAADDVINIPSGTVLANKISVEHSMAITVGGTLTVAGDRAITADDGLDDGSILTVDVLQGGSITAGDDAVRIKGNVKDGTVNIDNAGTITANGGQAIDLTDVTAKSTTITITNEAGGVITAIDADAIRGGGNTVIDNSGVITSVATGDDVNDGIDFQDDGNGTIYNRTGGSIIGAHHGITGAQGITVVNEVGGTIIGQSGSAVNIDNEGGVENTVTVINHGTMLGNANPAQDDSDGDAVDVDGLLKLDNYGLIDGTGANGTHDGGANVSEGVAAGGGTINNYEGGTIHGYGRAIQIDDSENGGALAATTIYNEGTIQGDGHGPENFEPGSEAGITLDGREAIDILGTFADTITNKGTILGGVFTDGGNDTLTNSGTMTALKDIAIDMGAGNDKVILQAGSNITGAILLGAGDDSLTATGATKQINVDGGDGNDTIVGTDAGDTIAGGAGNDTITGGKGVDKLSGGDGDDTFKLGTDMLGSGTRAIILGDGTTATVLIEGLAGTQDVISGGAGYDKIVLDKAGTSGYVFDTTPASSSYTGIEEIDGTSGNDVIMVTSTYQSDAVGGGIKLDGGAGNDTLGGGAGNDTILGGDGNDLISGLGGNDNLQGAAGNDVIWGGDGDDSINGGSGADMLHGDAGADTIYGSDGNDEIHGGDGNDQLQGEGGNDTIYGDAGSDFVVGGDGNDTISGGDGNDQLFGQNGDDTIDGGTGSDKLSGDAGNDTLIAGAGDTVLGGTGDDAIIVSIQDGNPASIDGGDGDDTVHLTGQGTGAFGKTTSVETLDVDAGTWTVKGTGDYDAINIAAGATLTNAISVEHSMAITVGGTLTVDGDRAITADDGLDDGSTLTVTVQEGGLITSGDDAIRIKGDFEGGTVSIDNAGTIVANGGQAIDLTDVTSESTAITITNEKTGVITAVDADAIRGGGNTTIDNYGAISSVFGEKDLNDAIDFQDDGKGTVHNRTGGSIIGAHHAITGSQGITVINDEDALISGLSGSAVNIDNEGGVDNMVTVTNRGTMLGNADAGQADSDGDAVDVDGLLHLDNYGEIRGTGAYGYHDGTTAAEANVSEGIAAGGGTINNYAGATIYGYGRAIQIDDSANGAALGATTIYNEGTIQGDGHGPANVDPDDAATVQANITGREAIDIIGTHDDTITNTATGKIIGGIFTDGGVDTLTNDGTITAMAGSAVNMGDGNDIVSNSGTITGAVLLGAGDDTFNVKVGSKVTGTIDGGDGIDTVNLKGTGTGSFGATVNVERLNVQSGTWTISSSQNYRAIDVANGATIAAAVILGAGEALTVEQGGTVQANGGVVVINGGTSDTTVTNDGTIKVLTPAGQKVDAITVNSGTVTVHNTGHGVIEGARHAITGPGAITVINDAGGVIVGHNGSAVNMDNGSSEAEAAHITNYGTMLGDSAGTSDSDGDAIDVDGIVYLDNHGMVRGEGANGTHKGEANVSEGVAAGGGTIHNYAGATIYGYGRAIQIDNSSNGPAAASTTIINDGTIQGDGHPPVNFETGSANGIHIDDREAIDILGSFADTITNTATGKILGGVFTDGGNDTLTNSGTMTALKDMAIDMGVGDDRVTNNGTGVITGSVALGDGDDSLSNDGTITVTHGNAVSMGDGKDYLGLSGTITGNVDAGAGNDEVITQSTSHIFGTVSLGDGDDHFNSSGEIKAGSADAVAIDMGAGDDWLYLYNGTSVQGTIQLGAGNDFLASTANGGYVVDAGDGNDTVSMSSSVIGGDDVLNGGAGNDSLDGGLGNDTLDGGDGNDTLFASAGSDTLIGGTGSDLYYYWSGNGNDTIDEGAGNAGDIDTLSLTDFNIDDVTMAHTGDDLVITLKDGSTIIVSDQFADGGVENIIFKDGEIDRGGIVDATNHAPTVDPTTVTVDEDKSIDGRISAHDLDGDKLTYTMVPDNAQHHGSFVVTEDGQWTYTPDKDYYGHDSFTVRVSDGHTTVDTTIDVTINPVNDAPVAVNDAGQVGEHGTKVFDLVANDTDVDDGQPHLTHFNVDGVEGIDLSNDAVAKAFQIVDGKLQFVGGDIFGALNDGDHATVTITYTAEDSHGASTTGEFTLTVDGVTDMHQINGTSGTDVIVDTSADDHITAGDGNDIVMTSQGSDIVDAGAGDDTVMARTGNATVNGGDGNDTIVGGSGNTVLNGDAGNDTITGGSGNETLNGGEGNDTLISTGGKDILIGGHGNDLLIGGANTDTFVFKPGDGQDTVANFTAGAGAAHDMIEVDSHTFANFDAVMAAIHDTAAGAQLQYADGSTMTLNGVTKDHLTVDDFHFA